MLQPRVASGTVTAKGSSTLTDSNAAYGALTANQFYVLITNGTDAGVRATISSNTTTQLNLASDLNSFDIIGSTYEIRKHATIGKLFGTNNSANLGEGANSSAADNVQVTLSGSGVETFYYSNGAPMGWKDSGDVDATNTVVDPIAGVTVARKVTGDRNLYLSGAVRLASVRADIATGNSTVTNPNSEGISLDDLNLFTGNASTGFVGGTNPLGNTDNLLVFNTDGSVSRYFWWTGTTPNGWADTTFTAAGTVVIPPGAAIVIQRKTANGTLQWSVPTAP